MGPVGENAERAARNSQQSGRKGRNARLAKETLDILDAGCYKALDGSEVDLTGTVAAAVKASTHYPTGTWRSSLPPPQFEAADVSVEVWCCTTLYAAQTLAQSGKGGAAPGVLNFASARNPGGGFATGAEAQEESLARSSALYPCLTKHFEAFFEPNRQAKSGAYTHAALYSPGVPVIRDEHGELLARPYLADFATAAAPNRGAMKSSAAEREAEDAFRERIPRVLELFARHGARDLVLGAWGCGVFRNSPKTVAGVFREHLSRTFRGHFRQVVFAVLDPSMAEDFAWTFRVQVERPCAAGGGAAEEKEREDGAAAEAALPGSSSGPQEEGKPRGRWKGKKR
jgi:uncharacterized protein (TIGR02452 family)